MREAICISSSQPRSPRSRSLHPKSSVFPGSGHAQKDPRKAGEILATSDYSLPPARDPPSLPQSQTAGVTEQWDRKQGGPRECQAAPQGQASRVTGFCAPDGVCGPKKGTAFSKTRALTRHILLVLGSWERLPSTSIWAGPPSARS